MIVACPSCKAKFRIDEGRIKPPGVRLRCARCQNLFAVRKRVVERPARAGRDVASAPPRQAAPVPGTPKILIAHGEPVVLASMQAVLEKESYEVLVTGDGVDALMKIQREQPQVAVIDVALPKMYGFEICEFLKRNESLSAIKVVLVAAEHKHRRYKRTPENFYGADDVIEEWEIQADLADKLRRLLQGPGEEPGAGETEAPVAETHAAEASAPAFPAVEAPVPAALTDEDALQAPPSVERVSEPLMPQPAPPAEPPGRPGDAREQAREKARRLARIIVSDIALYNPEAVEKGIRAGGLAALVRDDLEEGYKLFRSRIDESVAAEQDFIREALDAFIGRKRRELGIAGEVEPEPDRSDEEHSVPDEDPPLDLGIANDDF